MNQKIEIENRNQQMNWGIEMENRNYKYKFEELFSVIWIGIGFGFLILALIIGIFSYGFGFEIEICKPNPKIENKIQDSGRIKGDNIEATGYAGNWNGNFDIENEIEILDLKMVEYSYPPFFFFFLAESKTIQYLVAGEARGVPLQC